jgi:hypothetical protein
MLRGSWVAVVGLAIALVVTVRVEEYRMQRAREQAAELAMRASNVAAERDSTRDVAMTNRRVAGLLGDSLRMAERMVVQVTQRADELDQALGSERLARYRMEVGVAGARTAAATMPAADSVAEVRRARFTVRQEPYTVLAEVSIPARPDSARIDLAVALDPIHVEARVSCSVPDSLGVRSASIAAATPAWASVKFDRVEQAPELCAQLTPPRSGIIRRLLGSIPLVAGVGLTPGARWGLFLGLGTRL